MNHSLKLLAGASVALIGALLAVWLKTPLPWMLGPLFLVAFCRVFSAPIASSAYLRYAGQWGIGTSLGLYFTPLVVGVISQNIGLIVCGMLFAFFLGIYGSFLYRNFADVDMRTAWFASSIGGASEMTSLAEKYGGRQDLVASAHSLRILTVVVVIPFAFQALGVVGLDTSSPGPKVVNFDGLLLLSALTGSAALLASYFKVPNGWVLGPMFVSMTLTMSGTELSALPDYVSKTGQLLIGWSLGDKFRSGFFRTSPKFLFCVIFCSISSLLLAVGLALVLASWSDIALPTLILGLAPGGIAEMAITAKVLQLGIPLVTAFQISRMAFVVLVTGPAYQFVISRFFED